MGKPLSAKNQRNDYETETLIAFSADRDGGDAAKDLSPTLKHGGSEPQHHNAFKKMAVAFAWQQGNQTDGKTDKSRIVRAGDYAGSVSGSRVDAVAFMAGAGAKAGSTGASETLSPTLKGVASGTNQVPSIARHENKSGQLTPSEAAKALRAGASHSYQDVGVRRLTPTECEILQGFPRGRTEGVKIPATPEYIAECARKGKVPEAYVIKQFADSIRYRMLGNAVCVNVTEWIGKRLALLDQ